MQTMEKLLKETYLCLRVISKTMGGEETMQLIESELMGAPS